MPVIASSGNTSANLCTIFFADHTSYTPAGWSESHYDTTVSNNLPASLVKLQALAIARQALLSPGISVNYLRVSNTGIFRDSQILPGLRPLLSPSPPGQAGLVVVTGNPPNDGYQGGGTIGNPNFAADNPDMPWTAVLIRGEAGAPYQARSMFWLAGLPDQLTWSANAGITDPVWKNLFTAFALVLTSGGWGFLGQDNGPTNSPTQITNIAVVAGLVEVTANGHGLSTGQTVSIRGVKTYQQQGRALNGKWQILFVDANTITLLGSNLIPAFFYLGGGTVQLQRKALLPYVKVFQRRFGSRKRGRPFGLLSGRRLVRKKPPGSVT